jgi:N-acylneuraminate cytidylyltransferase
MNVYAFVFARGGSKGLPGKNIKSLAGIPLIGHSILLAQQMQAINKIFVSTDSEEIASTSKDFGAEIIRRPQELASDNASEWLAWQHAIRFLRERGEEFDTFLSLPATSPLREEIDVKRCLDSLSDDTDAVITVTPAARSPYFNMVTRANDGTCKVVINNPEIFRRQDAPEVFDITTVAYVLRPGFILNNTGLFSGRVRSVIVPKERAVDIDDAYDFMIAERLYNNVNNRS